MKKRILNVIKKKHPQTFLCISVGTPMNTNVEVHLHSLRPGLKKKFALFSLKYLMCKTTIFL